VATPNDFYNQTRFFLERHNGLSVKIFVTTHFIEFVCETIELYNVQNALFSKKRWTPPCGVGNICDNQVCSFYKNGFDVVYVKLSYTKPTFVFRTTTLP